MTLRINIDGQVGNGYSIMGLVGNYGDQLGWSKARQAEILSKMRKPRNYQGLIDGFNEAFEGIVELYSQREEEQYPD
ncbi:MAG: hypothetical protein NXH70_02035 [Hyphomonas sp.]|nr:hypothetical protein [Hyphomonas sp.]